MFVNWFSNLPACLLASDINSGEEKPERPKSLWVGGRKKGQAAILSLTVHTAISPGAGPSAMVGREALLSCVSSHSWAGELVSWCVFSIFIFPFKATSHTALRHNGASTDGSHFDKHFDCFQFLILQTILKSIGYIPRSLSRYIVSFNK